MRRRYRPSLGALQAFEAAARHASFTRAGQELNLTQGAISRQIRGLEAMLSVRLFELVGRRVVLTDAGRGYLADIRRTLQELEEATMRLMSGSDSEDIVELATLPTFCARWLIPRLPRFYADHPRILVNCATRLSPFDLTVEGFDAAIHFGPPAWPGGVLDRLFPERLAPVCSPSYRDAHALRGEFDVAHATRLHQTSRPEAWSDWFSSRGLTEAGGARGVRYDQFSMLSQAAIAGLGVALLPEFLIEDELRAGQLVRVAEGMESAGEGYYLVVPEAKIGRPALAAFRTWIREEADRVLAERWTSRQNRARTRPAGIRTLVR